MSNILQQLQEAVCQRQKNEVRPLTQMAIDRGLDPNAIIKEGFVPAMDKVGDQFASGQIFIPEMLASAKLMKDALELVKPLLKTTDIEMAGKVLIGTVKGDLHDIGKNIVIMMLEGAGFKVVDLGVDLSAEDLVASIKEEKPQVLGLSALLTTTMPEIKKVIDALSDQGLRRTLKIMVGGAPLDAETARVYGADAYGCDATEAVKLAKSWV